MRNPKQFARLAALMVTLGPLLNGCAVVSVASTVVSTTVGVGAAVVGTTVSVGSAVVGTTVDVARAGVRAATSDPVPAK